ncbi:MAG: molybdopterin-dependent oxidoreductase [Gammaproteobacteria bacterium]
MKKIPIAENSAAREHKYTTCYMCACRCGVRVTLEGGKIRFVEGNPNHPVNHGVLCAKGNAAAMKQLSPAKLRAPLLRTGERGAGEFSEISWDRALNILTERLAKIRAKNPNLLAFFTGRDQMQALTGLWARQFGTLNWASHGGFCSVNMAAAGLLTHGYSFWEFGEPDWERAKYFMLWGVAEDHASNPLKIGIKKLKERGVKIVAVNPVRTGYQAVADEWIPITPGGDGALAAALIHVLLREGRADEQFLRDYTNMPWLADGEGLFARDENGDPLVWDEKTAAPVSAYSPAAVPQLCGEYELPGGRKTRTAMTLALAQYLSPDCSPEAMSAHCGVAPETIRRLAGELAHAAFAAPAVVEEPWTDWRGRRHESFIGRPVAMHAMRGVSAHSNGFQTCRLLHFLQAILGALDCPGGHLAKPPYPKHPPAASKPAVHAAPNTPLSAPPLGIPAGPEDLAVDENGAPLRIDHAYSWDAPLAAHGAIQSAAGNAARAAPYSIDTLLIFMANLAWNSAFNPDDAAAALTAKNEDGEYKIPFVAVADSFHSETVNYADLVLPDTTYLERYDAISMLDRPISEPHAACDAIRAPVLPPDRDVRPWQEVLVELAARLRLPVFTDDNGAPKYSGYEDFIARYEQKPGIGFLAGWRGKNGESNLRGAPNPRQWEKYIENECFYRSEIPPAARYFRFANRAYLQYAHACGWTENDKPMFIQLYSETLRKFQRAGEGKTPAPPDAEQRRRLREYFYPLPFYYPPLETADGAYPFYAVTQRPMFMYHSWDSQNAWLRQIAADNYIYMQRARAEKMNIANGDWVWLSSRRGRIAARAKLMDGVAANTVWTWNAIGNRAGAWGLDARANENVEGFLMNHLLHENLPAKNGARPMPNADPITGQAAWYDLRVNIEKMSETESAKHGG